MDNYKPRVFLSHSGNDGLVKEVLDELDSALLAAECEPLVDRKDIMGGSDYLVTIDKFVATCDAAVFVISDRATDPDHPWVRNEANQLRPRMREPAFQGVPVCIENVAPGTLGSDWTSTGLDFQNGVAGDDAAVIAADVVKMLDPLIKRVKAEHIARALALALQSVDRDVLRDAAQPVGGRWITGRVQLQVARRLLEAPADQIIAVARNLAEIDLPAALATLDFALPFTWVDLPSAQAICEAISSSRPGGFNTDDLGTPKAYVKCGWAAYPPWRVKPVGPAPQGELLAEELERQVRTVLNLDDGDIDGDDQFDSSRVSEVVLAVDCPRLDEDIVERLESFAGDKVGVVFLAHDARWNDLSPALGDRIALLKPELDREREREALKQHRTTRDELKNLNHRYNEAREDGGL